MTPKPTPPVKRRSVRKNLVALDGTLDKVRTVRATMTEKGREADPSELRMHQRDAIREWVECNNPGCHEGGFSLGNVLREMVATRQEDFIGTNFCVGHEGDPDVPSTWTECQTRFDTEIKLVFR